MAADIRRLTESDAALLDAAAPGVFDDPIVPAALKQFLAQADHHLFVALDEGAVVGFISAVHYAHPDKPAPELWLERVNQWKPFGGQDAGKECRVWVRAALCVPSS